MTIFSVYVTFLFLEIFSIQVALPPNNKSIKIDNKLSENNIKDFSFKFNISISLEKKYFIFYY